MKRTKRFGHLAIRGIRSKVVLLILLTIVLLTAAFLVITINRYNMLAKAVKETSDREKTTVSEMAEGLMNSIITESLGHSNQSESQFADRMFTEAKKCVMHLAECAQRLFDHPEYYTLRDYREPTPENDGKWTSMVIYAPGTDPSDPELKTKLGQVANLSEIMISLCRSFGVTDMYIGLPEGAYYTAGNNAGSWFEDGKILDYDPRKRIWYQKAAEAGELIFTDGEIDANTGEFCIECAMPVYDPEGELQAVIGLDLFLNEIQQVMQDYAVSAETNMLVNQDGRIVLPTQAENFPVAEADRTGDLRESSNAYLAQVIGDALKGRHGEVTLGQLEDGEYYMVASPIECTGWVLVSAYNHTIASLPADALKTSLEAVQSEAAADYMAEMKSAQTRAVVLLAAVVVLTLGSAVIVGARIVKPLNTMTRHIAELGEENLEFKMEDAYRTGDEVEELAESFASMSQKTIQYMDRVVKVTAEKERIGAELTLATDIQATMMPHHFPAFPDRTEFDIYAGMDPAKEVGGDFYDFFLIDDDHLCMVIADVSGKGVPAALFMMSCKIIIADNAMMGKTPAQVLRDTNTTLCANEQEDMFVTAWVGILELSTGKLTAANGGHEYPVLMRNGHFELYRDVHGLLVGGVPSIQYENYEVRLNTGDKLFVYTDGIPEAQDSERKMFGLERMVETLNAHPEASPKELLKNMRQAVDDFVKDAEQFDDVTMLCLEYIGKTGEEKIS